MQIGRVAYGDECEKVNDEFVLSHRSTVEWQADGRTLAVDWTGLSCLWTLLSIVQLSTPESAAAAAAGPFNDNNQLPNELMRLSWRHDSHNF